MEKSFPDKLAGLTLTVLEWILSIGLCLLVFGAILAALVYVIIGIYECYEERRAIKAIKAMEANDTESAEIGDTESTMYERTITTTPEDSLSDRNQNARNQDYPPDYVELQDLEAQI
ncbi:uncharacterized protein N7483_001679 [Penicillium malachiteum]|uniref:uncharacterized protein n=1 Tax=Penicillium malachiteum TaxID=1324776 RepID=UPI0025491AD5|nr:uncharacterized protein N7483_001679 [Penicillium malachiteum]KAJ5736554.1 hypothetical protein N7483_001679 [Penicillium malachiteum]